MTTLVTAPTSPPPDVARPPAWRWVHVAVAALAMVATMPGRTQGLGLITEPLRFDLRLDQVTFGGINSWATLLGAAFCLPCGWLLDRLGVRAVLVTILAALGLVVILMSRIGPDGSAAVLAGSLPLFVLILLTRGFGQSALSVVSLALVGKAAGRRPGLAIGIYSALGTPAFWVFALATSFYGLVQAGLSLFNQSILAVRHFDRGVFLTITMVIPFIGLASNLTTGWLATRWPLGRLLAVAMLLLGASLVAFPFVEELWQVYAYAAVMGMAGGMVTVLFFAVWGQAFGPAHLGQIQGAAQMLTVFASAVGPYLLAVAKQEFDSYVPLFYTFAAIAIVFAAAAWWTRLPRVVPQPVAEASHA